MASPFSVGSKKPNARKVVIKPFKGALRLEYSNRLFYGNDNMTIWGAFNILLYIIFWCSSQGVFVIVPPHLLMDYSWTTHGRAEVR